MRIIIKNDVYRLSRGMSWYSLSTSTSSVGFTGTPLRARQRPPVFSAFLSVERMRVGWSGSMVRGA